MQQPFIQIQQVSKNYGAYCAVNNMSFDIPKGNIFGLLGPNGAGKSSLLRMITGITHPDTGTIKIDGQIVQGTQHQNWLYARGAGLIQKNANSRSTPIPSPTKRIKQNPSQAKPKLLVCQIKYTKLGH
jgi:ABC-type multidrug transport system ATPase subunit